MEATFGVALQERPDISAKGVNMTAGKYGDYSTDGVESASLVLLSYWLCRVPRRRP